jgi:hypothetical protein
MQSCRMLSQIAFECATFVPVCMASRLDATNTTNNRKLRKLFCFLLCNTRQLSNQANRESTMKGHDISSSPQRDSRPTTKNELPVRCDDFRFPGWALDPTTKQVMTCPVTIRAPCNHTIDKSSFIAWTNQGRKDCPVCHTPMKQLMATLNKDIASRLQQLNGSPDPIENIDKSSSEERKSVPLVPENTSKEKKVAVSSPSPTYKKVVATNRPSPPSSGSSHRVVKTSDMARKLNSDNKPSLLDTLRRNWTCPSRIPVLKKTVG